MILDERQLKCLGSLATSEVFAALRGARPSSATELGRLLHKSPATILYHIKALVEVGLVVQVGTRATARKPEALYQAIEEPLRLPTVEKAPHLAEVTRKSVLAALRST